MPGFRSRRCSPQSDDVLRLGRDQRPRADEAHLAAEHVPELRQLVDRRPAQDPPDAGHARVVRDLEHPRVAGRVLVQVGHGLLQPLGVAHHRAELEDRELAARLTNPGLPEEDRAGAVELDREAARTKSGLSRTSPSVETTRSIERFRSRADRPRARGGRQSTGIALDGADAGAGADQLEVARHDVDLDERILERADQGRGCARATP